MNIVALKKKLIEREKAIRDECNGILEAACLETVALTIPNEIKGKLGNALTGNGLRLNKDSLKSFGYEVACDESEDKIVLNNEYNSIIKCRKVYYIADSDELKFKLVLEFKLAKPVISTNIQVENNPDVRIIGSCYYTFCLSLSISSMVNPNINYVKRFDYEDQIKEDLRKNNYLIFPESKFDPTDDDAVELLKNYHILNDGSQFVFEYDLESPVKKVQISLDEYINLELYSENVNYARGEKYLSVYTYIGEELLRVGVVRGLTLNKVTIDMNYLNSKITKKLGTVVITNPEITSFTLDNLLYLEFEPKYWMSDLSYNI